MVVVDHFWLHALSGAQGVTVFFVISGFLITWLLQAEMNGSGTICLKDFYRRRMLRIFPAYYAFLGVYLLLYFAGHIPIDWAAFGSAAKFLMNYRRSFAGHFFDQFWITWSLGIEEQFYLLWPLSFLLFGKRPKALSVGLICLITAVNLYRVAAVYLFHFQGIYVFDAFETRCDALAVGCLLAIGITQGYGESVLRAIRKHPALVLLPVAALLALILSRYGVRDFDWRRLFTMMIEPWLSAVLIAQLIYFGQGELRWLESQLFLFLGPLFYSLYLYHLPVLQAINAFLHGQHPRLAAIIAAPLSLIAALCSYRFIEQPFLRLRRRGGLLRGPTHSNATPLP